MDGRERIRRHNPEIFIPFHMVSPPCDRATGRRCCFSFVIREVSRRTLPVPTYVLQQVRTKVRAGQSDTVCYASHRHAPVYAVSPIL